MRSLQTIIRKHRTAVLGLEQRIHPRYGVSAGVGGAVRSPAGDFSCPAKVRNLSLSGVSLACDQAFRPGDLLQVEFVRTEPDFACTLLLRVVHCTEMADGDFLLGGQFIGELDSSELKVLIG